MKPRDLFHVAIGTIGVFNFFTGAMKLVDSLLCTLGLAQLLHTDPKYYAFGGVIQMALSVILIKGYPPFLEMMFPTATQEPKPPESKADQTSEQ